MIQIVNCLLTRKCNLECGYCRISGDLDYLLKPSDYPDKSHYLKNERPPAYWIELIDSIYEENPDAFFIWYGGEPFMYKGLADVINHANKKGINYTIISNSTDELAGIREQFFNDVGKVKGYTASVDPFNADSDTDEQLKSSAGYRVLKDLHSRGLVEDPVAEITCDVNSIHHVEETIARLTADNIYSDLTVLDIAYNNYYDFSSVTSDADLVQKNDEVEAIFKRLIDSDYLIHMKSTLLPKIYEMLPANLDCGFKPGNIHNITIDADGTLRTCLRIKGQYTPDFKADRLFNESDRNIIEEAISADKEVLCKGCSWTCAIMSQLEYTDVLDH